MTNRTWRGRGAVFSRGVVCVALGVSWLGQTQMARAEAPAVNRSPARAEAPVKSPESEAAAAFEEGVGHYKSHRYEAAARAFLRADVAMPASDTLFNALSAAKKSGNHLLTVEVARRALSREESDPGLAAAARAALAESGPHLAQLTLSCSPAPCLASVDGNKVSDGTWLNPGTHRLSATWPKTEAGTTRNVTLSAGANYSITLEPETDGAKQKLKSSAQSVPDNQPQDDVVKVHVYDEVILGVAGAASLGLISAVTWSGLDAKKKADALGPRPATNEVASAEKAIRRTDALLGCAIGASVFTVAWAIWGVDYKTQKVKVGASAAPEHLMLSLGGAF